jgi:hypothetical protein
VANSYRAILYDQGRIYEIYRCPEKSHDNQSVYIGSSVKGRLASLGPVYFIALTYRQKTDDKGERERERERE